MGRYVLVLTLFFLGGCAGKTVEDKQRAQLHLQMGNGHLNKGNYPGALGEYLKAEDLDPESAIIQNQVGLAYFMRGRPDLAEKHFSRAIELDGRFTEARNNYGRALIENKKFPEAIKQLKRASKDLLYGEPERTYANLGLAYFQTGDFDNAEKQFLESLKLRKDNCLALSYYGRSLYELSSYEKAAESLDRAMKTCKALKLEDPYYFSAMSYMKLGKREEAAARLEEGLQAYPEGQFSAKARSMLELLK